MKNFASLILILSCSLGFIASTSDIESTGAPIASTGAPSEQTCAASGCHDTHAVNSGSAFSELLNDFGSSYEPGEIYNLTVRVTDEEVDRFGFELVALNATGNNAGELMIVDKERTQLLEDYDNWGDRQYATYTFNGTKANTAGESTWDLSWQAPYEDQGPVTFYLATVSADNDYTDDGDYVYTTETVLESTATAIEKLDAVDKVEVFPNPIVSDFGIKLELNKNEKVVISLNDMNGREVQSIFNGDLTSGVQTVKGRVSKKLRSGLYVINIEADGKEWSETVIVK